MQKQSSIKNESVEALNPLSQFIQRCLEQYEEMQGSQNQYSQYDDDHPSEEFFVNQQEEVKYYGYEDKKSITIKPLKMHKDLISLRKENQQKKAIISNLERENAQLKKKYQLCMMENMKVEQFLKDIEFTFKNDKHSQKANEVMMKTKKMLYRQALECQYSAKKLTRSQQAGKVQQLKLYIELLQKQKTRLRNIIEQTKKNNERLHQEQDFTAQNEEKFQTTLQRVQQWLNVEMLRVKRRQQIYLIEQGMISTGLKEKEILLKKKSIDRYYDKLKDLLLEKQGEQYEIEVLEKKRKDKLKLIQQLKQFKYDILSKKASIQLLQKELKQKLKTHDYMAKWTKQLKFKLQEKKQNHINNKILYQKKISALSKEYEELNKKYKNQLADEQYANTLLDGPNKKKNNPLREIGQGKDYVAKHKQILDKNVDTFGKKIKSIKIEEIHRIVKRVKIWILANLINLQSLIKQNFLNWKTSQTSKVEQNLRLRKKQDKHQKTQISTQNTRKKLLKKGHHPTWTMGKKIQEEQNPPNEITLSQLIQNMKGWMKKNGVANENDDDVIKLARYVVEDGQQLAKQGKQSQLNKIKMIKTPDGFVPDVSISKSLALTIMKKFLQTDLQTKKQITEIKEKLKEFLIKNYDPFRLDLLKKLLSMGGLQALQQKNQIIIELITVTQYLAGNKTNGSSEMTTMRRNQQMHLQLDLDETIFLRKLKKHVIEEYYVSRFKELFDLMIFQQFGEIDRPRLGMFDRVCEIVTGKILLKQKVTRTYNFDRLPSGEYGESEVFQARMDARNEDRKNSLQLRLQSKSKQFNQKFQATAIPIKQSPIEQQNKSSYWIVDDENDLKGTNKNNSQSDDNQFIDQKGSSKQPKGVKMKSWLDDLMSDGEDEEIIKVNIESECQDEGE